MRHADHESVLENACRAKHKMLNWMVGTILLVVSALALIIGSDWMMARSAADGASIIKADLESYKASDTEHGKAMDHKIDALQVQIDRRFDATIKGQDKLDGKLDKVLDRLR